MSAILNIEKKKKKYNENLKNTILSSSPIQIEIFKSLELKVSLPIMINIWSPILLVSVSEHEFSTNLAWAHKRSLTGRSIQWLTTRPPYSFKQKIFSFICVSCILKLKRTSNKQFKSIGI